MAKTNKNDIQKGVGLHARRVIAYVVLIIISFFCLFWFYIMFINATRSNGQLQSGFTAIPSTNLLKNWNNLVHGTLPIWFGMFNSLIIAACSAVLCTYFSTMTAYAIHAYEFRMKRFIYPFILMIMMIPTQVTALGFIKLVTKMGLMDSFIPLIVPTIASPVVFFYMKQYMESALPLSLIEAARIDGSGEFRTFNSIVLPLMKPAIAVQAIFTFVSSWNNYFMSWILCYYMGNYYASYRKYGCRLGEYGLYSSVSWGDSVTFAWCYWGIYWENIFGNKGKTKIYY